MFSRKVQWTVPGVARTIGDASIASTDARLRRLPR